MLTLASKLGASKANLFLLGEPGVGKRHLAYEIHTQKQKSEKYLLIQGSASPEEIEVLLSDWYSTNGTLTVADVDSMNPITQELIARFLRKAQKVKVILTATKAEDITFDAKAFRTVQIGPLRERLDEIPQLVDSILRSLEKKLVVGKDVLNILSRGDWRGNVRQLVAVVGASAMISHQGVLKVAPEFMSEGQHLESAIENIKAGKRFILDDSLFVIEKLLIQRLLRLYRHNQSKSSKMMGLSEANFRYRLSKFGLPSARKS